MGQWVMDVVDGELLMVVNATHEEGGCIIAEFGDISVSPPMIARLLEAQLPRFSIDS
jgi:hypothetical protein